MLVSGPVAITRLENSHKHAIYVFGDIHSDHSSQTECPISLPSIRIDQLFKKLFEEHKQIGFFLETQPYNISGYRAAKEQSFPYLRSLRNLLADNWRVDPTTGKVQRSKTFPNVMFHYTDIRPPSRLYDFKWPSDLFRLENALMHFKTIFFNEIKAMENSRPYQKVFQKPFNRPEIGKAINDLKNEVDQEVQKFHVLFEKAQTRIKGIIKHYCDQKHLLKRKGVANIQRNVSLVLNSVTTKCKNCHSLMSDMYTLRRLLDRDYGTDVDYVYCGIAHMVNIVTFLLKNTDYKITHSTCNQDVFIQNHSKDTSWLIRNNSNIVTRALGYSLQLETPRQCVDFAKLA